jgi:GNAT superfamily N-acetyltransferase
MQCLSIGKSTAALCALTLRSSGAPTACHQAWAVGARTFSTAQAWQQAVVARLARTLGLTRHSFAFIEAPEYMSTIAVRQAVPSDLEELAVLFNQYREFQGKIADLPAARTFLQARLDHGESVLFIAHEHSEPVAFAQLYPSFSSVSLAKVFILNDIFVQESGRRKGVGSQLLDAVESYAWSHGAARVTLNVAKDNTQGQALYAAQGWSLDSQYFMYHRFAGVQ